MGGDATTARILLECLITIARGRPGQGIVMLPNWQAKRARLAQVSYVDHESLYLILGPFTYNGPIRRNKIPDARVLALLRPTSKPQGRSHSAIQDTSIKDIMLECEMTVEGASPVGQSLIQSFLHRQELSSVENETWAAKGIRGLVKTVFIGCYIAFLWASIHHVATFFNNFEADSGDVLGSYMLAGAFDITALVTTIGVMFFRKSMPRGIQMVVWGFIIGIAGYSFFINWEYAAHFQNASLVLQATGATTPIYDQSGSLHYVPLMQQNTILLFVNPFLASGFTVFSLIYSIIAEFFGTNPPTIEELQARKIYLEETTTLMASIKQLEGKNKGKGLIQSAKEKALEVKAAVKEVTKKEETDQESEDDQERKTKELDLFIREERMENAIRQTADKEEESQEKQQRHFGLSEEAMMLASLYEKTLSWLMASGSTVPLKTVSETMNLSMKTLHNRVKTKQIRATKNKEIVYKSSVIEWAISEIIPKESLRKGQGNPEGNREEMTEKQLAMMLAILRDDPEMTDKQLAEKPGIIHSTSIVKA